MGLFGDDPRDRLIATLEGEVAYLRGQVKTLTDANIALASTAAHRALNVPPPAPRREASVIPTKPWTQSAIGQGHYDITGERRSLQQRLAASRAASASEPPKAPGA